MLLNNKYAIGCHVMFYEIEVVKEYINSLKCALEQIENPENVVIDLFWNLSEYFEECESLDKLEEIETTITWITTSLKIFTRVNNIIYKDEKPYTVAFYRRDFNLKYCQDVDFLIWGESDCLLPKETFNALEVLKDYTNKNNIHRYITTFAVRKMWDESWKILEHEKFTDKPYYDMDTEEDIKLAISSPWSIRYTMSQEEMEQINNQTDEYDIRMIEYPKFDGSCLIISSDLILSGVNIPPGVYINGDDTSFMTMCMRIMGNNYKQFVIKNILKVHNRNHPKKRLYVKGEDSDKMTHFKRKDKNWYQKFNIISKGNLNILFDSQQRFKRIDELK